MSEPMPYKLCPRCQTKADVHAPVCARCGRTYKTVFAPPEVTRFVGVSPGAVAASPPTPKRSGAWKWLVAAATVVAVLTVAFVVLRRSATKEPLPRPTVAPILRGQPSLPPAPTPVYERSPADIAREQDEIRRRHTRLE